MTTTFRSGILIAGILIALLLVPCVSAQAELTVTKTVDPDAIYANYPDLGCDPQETTVTLSVTGYGGTVEDTTPMDIVFAIDSTGSMTGNDPSELRLSGAQDIVDLLDATRDQVGVIGWSTVISANQPLTQDFATAKAVIGSIPASGNTNGALGLQAAIDTLDANTMTGTRNEVIIFLTDGQFNTGDTSVAAQRAAAVAAGYKVYTVGLTTNPAILATIASETGGKNYLATSAADIAAIYQDILTTIVTNTAPSDVDVVEVTMPYIVDEGSFSIAPDAGSGPATFTWTNVGQYVGNLDNKLDSTETFTVTFTAAISSAGDDLDVDDTTAVVNYIDPAGAPQSQAIPQATLDAEICDKTPPVTACTETVNPAGKKVPPAGSTTLPGVKGGQNEDGFYLLTAVDTVDPDPQIFVVDTGSTAVFGPFDTSTNIKYTESIDAIPEQKLMGGPNSAVAWHIIGTGDIRVYGLDASGNFAYVDCLVPPPPK